ncbi:Large polyvalent protein associated domain-containing protein [Candidatus Magnetomoraceae bacterium gMMP-15]
MNLNHVQERLLSELLDYAKIKFPQIELKTITESPSNSNHIWAIISGIDWNDDDKAMDFIDYISLKQEDILVDYGYPISLMPIAMSE